MRTAAREHMLDLAEEAERIRATLTALSIGRKGDAPGPGRAQRARRAGACADRARGRAQRAARPARRRTWPPPGARWTAPRREAGTGWQWADEALLGQLRSACRIVRAAERRGARPGPAGRAARSRSGGPGRPDALAHRARQPGHVVGGRPARAAAGRRVRRWPR